MARKRATRRAPVWGLLPIVLVHTPNVSLARACPGGFYPLLHNQPLTPGYLRLAQVGTIIGS